MALSKLSLENDLLELVFNTEHKTPISAASAWLTVMSNYISTMSVPPSTTIAATASAANGATLTALTATLSVIPSTPPLSFLPIDTLFMPFLLTDINALSLTNVLAFPVGFGTYALAGINDTDAKETTAKKIAENIHSTLKASVWTNTASGATGTWG
jgi:hypothetical protein